MLCAILQILTTRLAAFFLLSPLLVIVTRCTPRPRASLLPLSLYSGRGRERGLPIDQSIARKPSPLLAIVALLALILPGCGRHSPDSNAQTLTLYCATDREIVEEFIQQFERETHIHVNAKFDTEAAKAVGLIQEIRQEKSNPQCDVLWGGGPFFATMLADDGCLAPAPADLIAAHGDAPRDPQGRWLGFAGVYRILIVNTDVLAPADRPRSIFDLADPKYKGHVGIANPIYGGMGAHVAALYATLGEAQTRAWLQGLKDNDVALCAGMADVKNRVASGELWFGITSTIDAHVAVTGGKPVAAIFPDQQPGGLGCMNGYNSIEIMNGAPHRAAAEQFLRFILREQTEKRLSTGPGQNIGLLPPSVKDNVRPDWIPRDVKEMPIDWPAAAKMHAEAQRAIREILLDK